MACKLDASRAWVAAAIAKLSRDVNRSADTHLILFPLPGFPDISLYFKDESVHPSGSLKHRLARSLFLYALVNGWIREGTTVIETSSGSTAVSEAYFAKLLGLRFIAVMPASTSPEKVALIARYGGEPHFVPSASECAAECRRLVDALSPNGHFLDQFTYAERATDYRGNNNIAASIFEQMGLEPHREPSFIVCGAGTGGTSATLGRYVRYRGALTEIVVADPERSVFADYFVDGDSSLTSSAGAGRIEGIGRGRVEPSFIRTAVDGIVRVPDAYSVGALLYLERAFGRRVGGSTGAIFCASLTLAEDMRAAGRAGSIVAILCDGGERYASTLYSREWRESHGLPETDVRAAEAHVERRAAGGYAEGGAGVSSSLLCTPETPLQVPHDDAASSKAAAVDEGARAGIDWPMQVWTRREHAMALAEGPG